MQSRRYNNASEVEREGLRLLEDRERLRETKIAKLRRLAEEVRLSGLSEQDGKAVIDRLEAKYQAMAEGDAEPLCGSGSAGGPNATSNRSEESCPLRPGQQLCAKSMLRQTRGDHGR